MAPAKLHSFDYPSDAPGSPAITQRTPAFASLAPRTVLRRLFHWRQLRPAGAPNSGGAPAAARRLSRCACAAPHSASAGYRDPSGDPGGRRPGVVWFRADLRLHDNEALTRATAECSSLLPVYCFDPREFAAGAQGRSRTGPFRAECLVQAVADLRRRLRAAGSELVVRVGRPEEVLAEVVGKIGAAAVYCHTQPTFEEQAVERRVAAAVRAAGAQLRTFWTNTLHDPADLPFALEDLPGGFEVYFSRMASVAPLPALAAVKHIKAPPAGAAAVVAAGEVPSLKQLGQEPLPPEEPTSGGPQLGSGGESEALRQLESVVSAARAASGARGAASGAHSSGVGVSNLSSWLATGCLSPRHALAEVRCALGGRGGDDATGAATAEEAAAAGGGMQWVLFELLWRDYSRLMTKRLAELALPKARPTAPSRRPVALSALAC